MAKLYVVEAVEKALQVLEYVVEEGRELSLTEVCYHVRLPKTTVFRYLQTLCHAGYVAHDPRSDRYRTGVRLWALGQSAGSRSVLCEAALPTMKNLRDRFNETINLAELDGVEVVYLEMVESRRSLRMLAKVGSRDPAYRTAVGKAILASLPDDHVADHLTEELLSSTPNGYVPVLSLTQELNKTRERGFAIDRGENEEGACCIGAPIFSPARQVIAGISLSAPASRLVSTQEPQIAAALVHGAAEISARLAQRS